MSKAEKEKIKKVIELLKLTQTVDDKEVLSSVIESVVEMLEELKK